MYRIIRYIRQNKEKIKKVALIVMFLIALIQLLNYLSGKNLKISTGSKDNSIYNESNGTILSSKSAVTGSTIPEKELKQVNNKIEEFIKYCNEAQIEKAYNLLSDSCKEEFYTNVDSFREYYYEPIFKNETRNYTIQNWVKDTYIVRFTIDLLATGKPVDDSTYQDYITIETINGEKKLNINKFICKEEINKSVEKDNIEITILSRNRYMEFEEYKIKVTNNTDGTILLDELLNRDTVYLKDNNETIHKAYTNELSKEEVKIYKGHTKTLSIKFDSPYISNRKIKKITFSDIVLNYNIDNKAGYEKTIVDVKL